MVLQRLGLSGGVDLVSWRVVNMSAAILRSLNQVSARQQQGRWFFSARVSRRAERLRWTVTRQPSYSYFNIGVKRESGIGGCGVKGAQPGVAVLPGCRRRA
jgi:hypothetical protein